MGKGKKRIDVHCLLDASFTMVKYDTRTASGIVSRFGGTTYALRVLNKIRKIPEETQDGNRVFDININITLMHEHNPVEKAADLLDVFRERSDREALHEIVSRIAGKCYTKAGSFSDYAAGQRLSAETLIRHINSANDHIVRDADKNVLLVFTDMDMISSEFDGRVEFDLSGYDLVVLASRIESRNRPSTNSPVVRLQNEFRRRTLAIEMSPEKYIVRVISIDELLREADVELHAYKYYEMFRDMIYDQSGGKSN